MRIIVAIKQIPDINEVKIDPLTNTLIRKGASLTINPLDLNSIEEGLRIKDKYNAEVIILSMGPESARKSLEQSLSLGAAKAYLINDRFFSGSDTFATSLTLSKAIQYLGKFLILLSPGKKASDGETGQVGPELAEFLNIPQINYVTKIKRLSKNKIIAESMTETGYETIKSKLPALITVVKSINVPRLANLKNLYISMNTWIQTLDHKILRIEEKHCGLTGSPTRVIKTKTLTYSKKTKFLSGKPDFIAGSLHKIISENLDKKKHSDFITKLNDIRGIKNPDKIFLIGETNNNKIYDNIFSLIEEAKKISLKISSQITVLFLGYKIDKLDYKNLDVHEIKIIDEKILKDFDANIYAEYLSALIGKEKPEIVLAAATLFGRALMPRLAAKLKTGLTADCTELEIDKNKKLLQIRPAIGGNILATIVCPDTLPQMATFKPSIISGIPELKSSINVKKITVDIDMAKISQRTKVLKKTDKKEVENILDANSLFQAEEA